TVRPETRPFHARVVGILRFIEDVQVSGDNSLSDSMLAGNTYAGPGWFTAHGADFSGYGSGVFVRLADGPGVAARFRRALREEPDGWLTRSSSVSDLAPSSPQHV